MTTGRFTVLHREPNRLLTLGIIGQFWKVRGGTDVRLENQTAFVEFSDPGFVKSAIDFIVEGRGSGSRLTTRTRNRCTDEITERRFGRYWRVVGPGSKLIRLNILRAVRKSVKRGRQNGRA